MDEIVVIRTVPYQESNIIMQCFSKGCGLIKVFTSLRGKVQVLSHAKASLWQKGQGFYYLRESGLIEPHLAVRGNFEKLKAAGLILRIIEKSQVEGRRSNDLFNMLISYLGILKIFTNPKALSYSFAFKVLEYEGLMDCDKSTKIEPLIKGLTKATRFEDLLDIEISEPQEERLKKEIDEALRALT